MKLERIGARFCSYTPGCWCGASTSSAAAYATVTIVATKNRNTLFIILRICQSPTRSATIVVCSCVGEKFTLYTKLTLFFGNRLGAHGKVFAHTTFFAHTTQTTPTPSKQLPHRANNSHTTNRARDGRHKCNHPSLVSSIYLRASDYCQPAATSSLREKLSVELLCGTEGVLPPCLVSTKLS